jgi:PhnB protein
MAAPVLHVHLTFDGTCAEALRFYERVLGAKVVYSTTWGDSPMKADMPPGAASRIIHARIVIAGQEVMAGDQSPGHPPMVKSGFTMSLTYPTVAETQRIFAALADGGNVTMPLAPTFFAETFGMCTDRFGTPWMVLTLRAER